MGARIRIWTVIGAVAVALVAVVAAAWLGVVFGVRFQKETDSVRFARSHGRFGQLKLALHAYHLDYGCFPPLQVAGEDGTTMHSWRVLLLPYFDVYEQKVRKGYDFTEAWNGPNNRRLSESMGTAPAFFRGPDDKMADKSWTTYVGVAGAEATWPRNEPLLAYLVERGSDRFLLVEVPNSGIHWMEPRDDLDSVWYKKSAEL